MGDNIFDIDLYDGYVCSKCGRSSELCNCYETDDIDCDNEKEGQ